MQFADLLTRLSYLPPKDIEVLSRAYDAAASAHHDQNRLSGEKFIEHPLSVAAILADLQLDRDTLAAAILHDRSEEHTSELQSQSNLVCRLLLEKKTSVFVLLIRLACS